jgi:hypothetical protein
VTAVRRPAATLIEPWDEDCPSKVKDETCRVSWSITLGKVIYIGA